MMDPLAAPAAGAMIDNMTAIPTGAPASRFIG